MKSTVILFPPYAANPVWLVLQNALRPFGVEVAMEVNLQCQWYKFTFSPASGYEYGIDSDTVI